MDRNIRKVKNFMPTEDECINACCLFDREWQAMTMQDQEKMLSDAKRWLKVWSYVLPDMEIF